MSALLTLVDPMTISAIHTQVSADGGIISTLNDQTNQIGVLVKNVAALAVVVMFLYIAHKARFAIGAVIGGLLICGLIFFAVNGGLGWLGTQFSTQFHAPAALGALSWRSMV